MSVTCVTVGDGAIITFLVTLYVPTDLRVCHSDDSNERLCVLTVGFTCAEVCEVLSYTFCYSELLH